MQPIAAASSETSVAGPRAVAVFRLTIAWLLTSLILPYAWGRSFIGWQLAGAPETILFAICVLVCAAVVGLTAGVAARPPRTAWSRWIVCWVGVSWVAVNIVVFWSAVTSSVPRGTIIAGYLPGSLLVPWLAWMFVGPWGWGTRFGVAGVLGLLLAVFIAVFRVDGLSGDSRVQFSYRTRSAVASKTLVGHSVTSSDGAVLGALEVDRARDFPQFLGPDRTGMLDRGNFAGDWSNRAPRELWRRPVGAGWSSFAVVGDYAFTQEQRGDSECVVAYLVATGAEVWVHADPANFSSSLGGPGPRATPTVHECHLFTIGATGLLNCLDAVTGTPIWSRDILRDHQAENITHGVCASPLVVDDWVVVCPTGERGPSLAAYDRATGAPAWSGGNHAASYSSPMIAELHGVRQILLYDSAGLTGHELGTGKPIWHFPWTNSVKVNVAQPIVHAGAENQILVTSGYDKGCALVRVDHAADGSWSVESLWSNNRLKTKFCSAVVYDGHAYGLDDGILVCLELVSGNRLWKAGRYGHGQLLLVGDRLLVQTEPGDVVWVQPDPRELREVSRFRALDAKTWNNPALAGHRVLVRNDQEAACYELPAADASAIGSEP